MQVLYVPDQDELARSTPPKPAPPCPKPAPPRLRHLSDSQQLHSSVESQGTLRSSSVSQPPNPTPQGEGGEDEGEEQGKEGGAEEEPSTTSLDNCGELFEEVAESHIVLVTRYISDDQVCSVVSHLSSLHTLPPPCRGVFMATS